MPEFLALLLAIVVVLLALDQVVARWGDDSRHELGDRNW
jgi:hypothetical protein